MLTRWTRRVPQASGPDGPKELGSFSVSAALASPRPSCFFDGYLDPNIWIQLDLVPWCAVAACRRLLLPVRVLSRLFRRLFPQHLGDGNYGTSTPRPSMREFDKSPIAWFT
jgi:hypothetical protein